MALKEKQPKFDLPGQYEQHIAQTRGEFEKLKADVETELRNRAKSPERRYLEKMNAHLKELESMKRDTWDIVRALGNVIQDMSVLGDARIARAQEIRKGAGKLFMDIGAYADALGRHIGELTAPSVRPRKIVNI
ncbi:Uncharacterised protein [uncultured archaeon]|nr:Uncharacterised protein [uncultured archaeon]